VKQTVNTMSSDEFYARKKERERLEVLQFLEEEKAEKRQTLRNKSLLGKRYHNVNFTNTRITNNQFKIAFDKCKNYCFDFKKNYGLGLGMYLHGEVGTGKTHLMACIVNDLIDKDQDCLVTSFIEINKEIKATFNGQGTQSEVIDKYAKVDYLFIDDFGTEIVQKNSTDTFMQEIIYDIINLRYNNLVPTIYTSNNSMNSLINDKGMYKKTIDRVFETSIYIIELMGKSERVKKYEVRDEARKNS